MIDFLRLKMGQKFSRMSPKYLKNFNIENKALKRIETIEEGHKLNVAPRHPSTKYLFEKKEGQFLLTLIKITLLIFI